MLVWARRLGGILLLGDSQRLQVTLAGALTTLLVDRYGLSIFCYIYIERRTALLGNDLNTIDESVRAHHLPDETTDTEMNSKSIYDAYFKIAFTSIITN